MKTFLYILLGLLLAVPVQAQTQPNFSRLIIFGDSLSDPGNVFVATGLQSVPPYSNLSALLVPDAPYTTGGHRFSNGKIWIEQLAQQLRLVKFAQSALRVSGAQNWAIGGGNALDTPNLNDLPDQFALFLSSGGASQLPDSLVVLQFGGNDVRDAIEKALPPALGGLGDVTGALTDLSDAAAAMADHIEALDGLGARNFLVVNSANIGRIPSIQILDALAGGLIDVIALATSFSQLFNLALDFELSTLTLDGDTTLATFNLYELLEDVVDDPASFGLSNTMQACVMPGIPPFRCKRAKQYLFWDGVHPTQTTHTIMKDQALAELITAGLVQ